MITTIDNAAHPSLNEQRDPAQKLVSIKTYDAEQNGPIDQYDCTALSILAAKDKAPAGFTEGQLPDGGVILAVFEGGHFARIETGGATRFAYRA